MINETYLIVIPARGGSKGIKRKNLVDLNGHPLIWYTLDAARKANLNANICITTDDSEIRDFAVSKGFDVPFLRPAELAQDNSGTIPVIRHAIEWYRNNRNYYPNNILLLQPTSPCRTAEDIMKACVIFEKSGKESLLSVNKVNEHPCEYITPKDNGFDYVMQPPLTPGRQNFPDVYFINGAIYICKCNFILDNDKLFDNKSATYEMSMNHSVDIDDIFSLRVAELIIRNKK